MNLPIAEIIRFGDQYVLLVKKHQPTLWQDIPTCFTDPQAQADEWKHGPIWNKEGTWATGRTTHLDHTVTHSSLRAGGGWGRPGL